MKRIGVIAGSFDPITYGHTGLIQQAMNVVDHLHVVVGHNPAKKYLFSQDERLQLTKDVLYGMFCDQYLKSMTVVLGERELLVQYAKRVDAQFLIRGIRNAADYTYESEMNLVNNRIDRKIETLFFMPDRSLTEISSSTVKGLVGFDNWELIAQQYVDPVVIDKLKEKMK